MKKIFIISLILLFVVLIFLGIYNFAFSKKDNLASQNVQPTKSENIVDSQALNFQNKIEIETVFKNKTLAATLDKKSNALFAYTLDGTLWKTDAEDLNWQQITTDKIEGLKKVLWSSDKSKALLWSKNAEKDIFYEIEYQNAKKNTLKDGLDTAVWDNMGTKIFYKYFDGQTKSRTLNIANPDGSGWQKLTDLGFRYVTIAPIPLTSLISFWNMPKKDELTELFTIGITGGDSHKIFTGRYGADYLWSPNGTMALISSLATITDRKISLGVIKIDGTYSDLNVPTFVSKCVWSQDGKTIYYALPGNISENAILPDDYEDGKFFTNDTFWKMDITTGVKERISDPANTESSKYDATSFFLSNTEDKIYFINKIDNKLYSILL